MNNAQIKKLQNQVAQNLKAKQELENKNIVKNILDVEKSNPVGENAHVCIRVLCIR